MADRTVKALPWPLSRLLLSLTLAALALGAGAWWTSPDVSRVRQILRRDALVAGADGRILHPLPPASAGLPVLVVRVQGGAEDGELTIDAAGDRIAASRLPAGRSIRLDVQVPGGLPRAGGLEFRGPAGWRLEYLEAANIHGFTHGVFNATFVPSARRDWPPPPWWLLLALGALLVPAGASHPVFVAPPWRRGRRLVQALAWLGVLLFVSVLIAPRASRYAVVLAPSSYLLCLVLVYLSPAARTYLSLRRVLTSRLSLAQRTVDGVVVVAVIAIFYAAAASFGLAERHRGDYSRFLHLSTEFARSPVLDAHPEVRDRLSSNVSGYDGQFMFLMAFDPLLTRLAPADYRRVADSPPYRYGRIGFSWLVRAASLGNPAAFPVWMVRLIVLGHLVSATFLVLLARQAGASPWLALGYVLIPGFLVSLACVLPESIAGALLLAGLWAHRRGRRAMTLGCWAMSLLIRETGVVLILAVVLHGLWTRTTRRDSLWLLLSGVPALAWRAYVGWRLAPAFGAEAWWHNPGDLTLPLLGFLRLWRVNDAAHGLGQPYNIIFPILLVALLALAVALWRIKPGAVATAAVLYALMAVSLDFEKIWAWLGNGERGTYEAFLMVLVGVLSVRELPTRLRWALGLYAGALFIYCFNYATHCVWFRPALLVFH